MSKISLLAATAAALVFVALPSHQSEPQCFYWSAQDVEVRFDSADYPKAKQLYGVHDETKTCRQAAR